MIGKTRESKLSNALYEQVLTKNFEVIETFLSQFNEIFSKQDEFETLLGKLDQKFFLLERNCKKSEELILRSSDMYEKKMCSLKEFILEKLKASGEKSQPVQIQPSPQSISEESGVGKQIFEQYEKHLNQQRRLQQNVCEHVKKIDLQINNMNVKLNSLAAMTNSLDERMRISMNLQDKGPTSQQLLLSKQVEMFLRDKIEEISKRVDTMSSKFQLQLCLFEKKVQEDLKLTHISAAEALEQVKKKINIDQFQEFKLDYKEQQSCIVREASQSFANKKETKKMFYLLQNKLLKLEMIQRIVKENNQNESIISIVPTGYHSKSRPNSIHSQKKSPKASQFTNAGDSMQIRRLESRKGNNRL